MLTESFPAARRLTGSNNYDDVKIDIPGSFQDVREWLRIRQPRPVKDNRFRNRLKLAYGLAANRYRQGKPWTQTATHDPQWFERFRIYWSRILGGVKIDLEDFFYLRSVYRQRCEELRRQDEIAWDDASRHLANWQHPSNMFHTFHFAWKDARVLVKGGASLAARTFSPQKRALEFGCGMAPMYTAWRRYFSHMPMHWTIVDIENFPFHYACALYGADASCECIPVATAEMDAPLAGRSLSFDVIYCQEVLEHSHAPLHTAQYLLDHLAPGGMLVFDYMKSEGHGLDTPAGVEERQATLAFLKTRIDIVYPINAAQSDFQSLTVGVKRVQNIM